MSGITVLGKIADEWRRERDVLVKLELPPATFTEAFQRQLTVQARRIEQVINSERVKGTRFPYLALAELLGQIHYGQPVPQAGSELPASSG